MRLAVARAKNGPRFWRYLLEHIEPPFDRYNLLETGTKSFDIALGNDCS
jgi:hypothetical protein